MVPIPKLRQLLQACGPRIITKLEEIVKSMDSILAGINDVYAAGAVEGYSPEYFILCPSKSFVSQTNSLRYTICITGIVIQHILFGFVLTADFGTCSY